MSTIKLYDNKRSLRPGCNNKRTYRSEVAATVALHKCIKDAENGDLSRKEQSFYQCGICGGWHLSSARTITSPYRVGNVGELTVSVAASGAPFLCYSWGQFPRKQNVKQYLRLVDCGELARNLRSKHIEDQTMINPKNPIKKLRVSAGIANALKLEFIHESGEVYYKTEMVIFKDERPELALLIDNAASIVEKQLMVAF